MGREIAYHYAKEGAKVLAVARRADRLQQLAADVKDFAGEIQPFAADISKEENVYAMIEEAINVFGTLDILVNNAGIMDNFAPVGDVDSDMWENVLSINLYAPFYAMKRAVKHFMEKGGGVIVNIVSISGLHGGRAGAAYTASKHGLAGLTRNTAFMYAKHNIRCNAICPGAIETEIASGVYMQNVHQEGALLAQAGIGANPRTGSPAEVAKVAVFLASDEAGFVNGQCIPVDGGFTAY
jgi:NAD(P)-dependent dehydrogenase (short-subunit alcohol dehydrogenase family)